MFCKNCGKEINYSSQFCVDCALEIARKAELAEKSFNESQLSKARDTVNPSSRAEQSQSESANACEVCNGNGILTTETVIQGTTPCNESGASASPTVIQGTAVCKDIEAAPPADAPCARRGFVYSILSVVLAALSIIVTYTAVQLSLIMSSAGLVAAIFSISAGVCGLVFGIKGIKAFKRSAAVAARSIVTLVLGIVGTALSGFALLYLALILYVVLLICAAFGAFS